MWDVGVCVHPAAICSTQSSAGNSWGEETQGEWGELSSSAHFSQVSSYQFESTVIEQTLVVERLGDASVYAMCIFPSILMVCLGLWLTISTELDDPRKSNPKPLHKHPKLLSAAHVDRSQCGSIWDHTGQSGTNWTRKFGIIGFSRQEDQNFDFWFLGILVPP